MTRVSCPRRPPRQRRLHVVVTVHPTLARPSRTRNGIDDRMHISDWVCRWWKRRGRDGGMRSHGGYETTVRASTRGPRTAQPCSMLLQKQADGGSVKSFFGVVQQRTRGTTEGLPRCCAAPRMEVRPWQRRWKPTMRVSTSMSKTPLVHALSQSLLGSGTCG